MIVRCPNYHRQGMESAKQASDFLRRQPISLPLPQRMG